MATVQHGRSPQTEFWGDAGSLGAPHTLSAAALCVPNPLQSD